jgi:hypothetical protein
MRPLLPTHHRSHWLGPTPRQAQTPRRPGHGRQFGVVAPRLPRSRTPRTPACCKTRVTAAAPPIRKRDRHWKRLSGRRRKSPIRFLEGFGRYSGVPPSTQPPPKPNSKPTQTAVCVSAQVALIRKTKSKEEMNESQ